MSAKIIAADAKQLVEQLLDKLRENSLRLQENINDLASRKSLGWHSSAETIFQNRIANLNQQRAEQMRDIQAWQRIYHINNQWEKTNEDPRILTADPSTLKLLFDKKIKGRVIICCNAFFEVGGLNSEEEAQLLVREKIRKSKSALNYLKFRQETPEADLEYERLPIPETIRNEVWRRDEGKCAQCKSVRNLEFDHIIPVSRGGSNTARNIQLLCEICNRRKSDAIG